MIYELFDRGYLNSEALLIRYYKKIGISENQLIIILLINSLKRESDRVYMPSEISKYMNISKECISKEIDILIENKFFNIEKNKSSGTQKINFSPIYNKIIYEIELENINNSDALKKLTLYVRKSYNIILSDSDKEIIIALFNSGLSWSYVHDNLEPKQHIQDSNELIRILKKLHETTSIKFSTFNWVDI
ncbi:DnaD family protein [Spiroplasma endosymbiont of Aspidapion aeneum]|uniref:DnaD family protein n=1 Tax=Spiroplasma endosymbiont of Aspidapion aeneum TaxID=3066276 RepID=UPI00313BF8B6